MLVTIHCLNWNCFKVKCDGSNSKYFMFELFKLDKTFCRMFLSKIEVCKKVEKYHFSPTYESAVCKGFFPIFVFSNQCF